MKKQRMLIWLGIFACLMLSPSGGHADDRSFTPTLCIYMDAQDMSVKGLNPPTKEEFEGAIMGGIKIFPVPLEPIFHEEEYDLGAILDLASCDVKNGNFFLRMGGEITAKMYDIWQDHQHQNSLILLCSGRDYRKASQYIAGVTFFTQVEFVNPNAPPLKLALSEVFRNDPEIADIAVAHELGHQVGLKDRIESGYVMTTCQGQKEVRINGILVKKPRVLGRKWSPEEVTFIRQRFKE